MKRWKMKSPNEIWLADLNPSFGTEAGKFRTVVIVQTDILKEVNHSSTLVCPITTQFKRYNILIIRILREENGINKTCDIMVDQICAIDNSRFVKKVGSLTQQQILQLQRNLKIVLELQ